MRTVTLELTDVRINSRILEAYLQRLLWEKDEEAAGLKPTAEILRLKVNSATPPHHLDVIIHRRHKGGSQSSVHRNISCGKLNHWARVLLCACVRTSSGLYVGDQPEHL